ncbi:TPA: hypothetical protein ACPZO0_002156 [Yersinia enterocolitica]
MPPDLIPEYNKDLSISLFGDKRLIESFYFFTRDAGLLRADEYIVSGGDYHYYLDVYLLGCQTEGFFIEHGCDLDDDGVPMTDLVHTLLELDMVDDNRTKKIGRVAYNDFNFIEEGGYTLTGKQIKSAVIDRDFQSAGLAREVYKMIVKKHDFLVCDNVQSIAGGALWASSIIRIAEIRIYDSQQKTFLDTLGPEAKGISGTLPWSCQHLSVDEIMNKWKRPFDDKCCRHIVHVIYKDKLIDE